MADETKVFEGWAIVELMGHRRLAGYVTEVEIAGSPMLRLDIPGTPIGDIPEVLQDVPPAVDDLVATQFYSAAALYCLTPTTEAIARAVAVRSQPTPVHQWELPAPAGTGRDENLDGPWEDDDQDGAEDFAEEVAG